MTKYKKKKTILLGYSLFAFEITITLIQFLRNTNITFYKFFFFVSHFRFELLMIIFHNNILLNHLRVKYENCYIIDSTQKKKKN